MIADIDDLHLIDFLVISSLHYTNITVLMHKATAQTLTTLEH